MALPAATTRSPDGILCEGPPYVVLKYPSRWRSDPWRFIFGRWVVGRALGVVGRWVFFGRWVLQGGDDEVSRRDTLQVASRHYPQASLKFWSRSVGVYFYHFLGVGCLGVGCWALGVGRWVFLGVGWSRAATRSLYRDFDSTFGSPD
jgi:hypothetical protein